MNATRQGWARQVPAGRPGERSHKPHLSGTLQSVGLDVTYHRGQGDFLYYRDPQEREIEVLDLVGGFGSLLLGHSHPAIVARAQQLLSECRPIHVQGSHRSSAAHLATELSYRARGDYCTVFANSGAEAVEAAMKHAMLATGSRDFLTLEGAFHGKTLGALQLTANERYRGPFQLSDIRVSRIRVNDERHLATTFANVDRMAGFVFEPILGEGGVRPVERAFIARAAELCAAHRVPLIADECQTGLGRTGHFLASEHLGVRPDYIILSKALGGGVSKISAVLIHREHYRDEFDVLHTSTFADDDYSCEVARKTLELIDEATLARCRTKGARLWAGINTLKDQYPDVIADVRGLGLMLGIEFHRLIRSPSFLLRCASAQHNLLPILAGYLLHVHDIRVAPTLSDPWTLRLQPSVFLPDRQIKRFLIALDDVCQRLRTHDAPRLTTYMLGRGLAPPKRPVSSQADEHVCVYDVDRFHRREQSKAAVRVAWLCHFIDANNLKAMEPAFGQLTFDKRQDLLDYFATRAEPVVMSAVDVRSRIGHSVQLFPILLPVTSRWMKHWIDARQYAVPRALVKAGVDVARSLDCSMIALGQYTSIVSQNGKTLLPTDIGVTTGNSYSLALAIQSIQRAQIERQWNEGDRILAIVGAAGNIGETCADLLAPRYRSTILLGNDTPRSQDRLAALCKRVPRAEVGTSVSALAAADVVLAATNAVDTPLGPEHFAPHAIVCDVSIPPSVRAETAPMRPDLHIIKGGIVRLPYGEDLQIDGFPLPQGLTYGCMAEGLVLGFEGVCDTTFTGALHPHLVCQIEQAANRHGFELAEDKTSCVLGFERREAAHVDAR